MMRPFNDVDLHAYVDEQVSPDRRVAIATYLATAPDDAARVETWKRQNASIRAMFAPPANDAVPLWLTVGQIMTARTGREQVGKPTAHPAQRLRAAPPPLRRHAGTRLSWTIAAVAFTAGIIVAGLADRVPRWSGAPALADPAALRGFQRRAWEAHKTFALDPDRPVDVTDTTPGRVEAWLDSRVPFRPTVPDLKPEGWTLLGGRLAPGDSGPAALLVYRDGAGDRLSLFAARLADGEAESAEPGPASREMTAWTAGSVGYALMSSKGQGWLNAHAPSLEQAARATMIEDASEN